MVQGMTLLLSMERDCEQLAREVAEQLNGSGLQVVRSFDLRIAITTHPEYSCPHHGAGACTCQLIVLLVYGRDGLPTALMIYGRDGQSSVFLVDRPEQRVGARQETSILHTLSPGNFNYVRQGKATGVA